MILGGWCLYKPHSLIVSKCPKVFMVLLEDTGGTCFFSSDNYAYSTKLAWFSTNALWLLSSRDSWPPLWLGQLGERKSRREREREWRLLPELCLISHSGRALFSINSALISFLFILGGFENTGYQAPNIYSQPRERRKRGVITSLMWTRSGFMR